jgi:hypothetical protein
MTDGYEAVYRAMLQARSEPKQIERHHASSPDGTGETRIPRG